MPHTADITISIIGEFYIAKSFINNQGKSTSVNIRKLGTLKELLAEHGPAFHE